MPTGQPGPLGATPGVGGANFALFSEHGHRASVCLFDPRHPDRELARHEMTGRTGHVFHTWVPGVSAGALYGFRVAGPTDPQRGHAFDDRRLLLDPYARAIHGLREAGSPESLRSVMLDDAFDWSDDRRPNTAWRDTVIHELHVRGFTRLHPKVPARLRGTYAGLAHPASVEHLSHLGITAVELLPVHAHLDEPFLAHRGLVNYWGYNTVGFFAVEPRYAAARDPAGCAREFKTMVKALHAAGIEVILDVVYNHTAEGGAGGPTVCWRGLDNAVYYHLDGQRPDGAAYLDFTGTGNSVNVGALYPMQMGMDSLRHWATEMHVDGFRFDLAPELTRAWPDYQHRIWSAFLQCVHQDPVVGRLKLIAEPWDLGPGGYRLGEFPCLWSEWNDRFRDGSRRFWNGDPDAGVDLRSRLVGSPDFFKHGGRDARASINFVTCHDGFTLHDLVTYARKHNEANGEGNRDGTDANWSTNHGIEGETDDPLVRQWRERHKRNLLGTLLLSRGVPMLLAGDEFGRTQRGNNNAYCQDNEISWLQWEPNEDGDRLHAFVRAALALRRRAGALLGTKWLEQDPQVQHRWLDLDPVADEVPPIPAPEGFALWLRARDPGAVAGDDLQSLLVVLNPGQRERSLVLPSWDGDRPWQLVLDTAHAAAGSVLAPGASFPLPAFSLIALAGEPSR